MEKGFNLSDKIIMMKAFGKKRLYYDAMLKKDVKEFIKKLKEACDRKLNACYIKEEIDKLAGDKLI